MSYVRSMLGASASASVSVNAGGSASSSSGGSSGGDTVFGRAMRAVSDAVRAIAPPPCITEPERLRAQGLCFALRKNADCNKARQPVCPPPAAPPEPPPQASGPKMMTGHSLDTSGAYSTRKLPVPVATAAPVVPPPLPEPEEGVPTWVWIAGGMAVLGTGAFLYSRRKAA